MSIESHHDRFLRQQHERRLTKSSIAANAAAAELIAKKIAAKLAEQNDIIYCVSSAPGPHGGHRLRFACGCGRRRGNKTPRPHLELAHPSRSPINHYRKPRTPQ